MASKKHKEHRGGENSSFLSSGTKSVPGREELVGKRFLFVQGGSKPKISRVQDWAWKAGVVRCASHVDYTEPDLQVWQIHYNSKYTYTIRYKQIVDNYSHNHCHLVIMCACDA